MVSITPEIYYLRILKERDIFHINPVEDIITGHEKLSRGEATITESPECLHKVFHQNAPQNIDYI